MTGYFPRSCLRVCSRTAHSTASRSINTACKTTQDLDRYQANSVPHARTITNVYFCDNTMSKSDMHITIQMYIPIKLLLLLWPLLLMVTDIEIYYRRMRRQLAIRKRQVNLGSSTTKSEYRCLFMYTDSFVFYQDNPSALSTCLFM